METNLISWNATNWITITLMALLGFMLLGLLAGGIRKMMPSSATPASSD